MPRRPGSTSREAAVERTSQLACPSQVIRAARRVPRGRSRAVSGATAALSAVGVGPRRRPFRLSTTRPSEDILPALDRYVPRFAHRAGFIVAPSLTEARARIGSRRYARRAV